MDFDRVLERIINKTLNKIFTKKEKCVYKLFPRKTSPRLTLSIEHLV